MAQWVDALVECLAGNRDLSGQFRRGEISARWPAAGIVSAQATARYAASDAYFSYQWREEPKSISIAYSGSGTETTFRVLLPQGFTPRAVMLNGTDVKFDREGAGESTYVSFTLENPQRGEVRIAAQ